MVIIRGEVDGIRIKIDQGISVKPKRNRIRKKKQQK